MAQSPSSYEALTVDLGIAMLANSATARAFSGAADSTAMLGYIVNRYGGDPNRAGGQGRTVTTNGVAALRTANYFLVDSEDFQRQKVALNEYQHSGQIKIIGLGAIVPGDTPPDIIVRGRNTMGAIAAEIEAQFGLAGRLLGGVVESHGPSLPDTTGATKGTYDFLITIDWSDVL